MAETRLTSNAGQHGGLAMQNTTGDIQQIDRTLHRLEQCQTVSPFSRMFYRLIYNWLRTLHASGGRLRHAFALFLRNELRRHGTVLKILHHEHLDLPSILRAGDASRNTLLRLVRALERMEMVGSTPSMVRELILAECHFHLGHTADVLHVLDRAVALGGRHPLIFFALGYNSYNKAVQEYTVDTPGGRRLDIEQSQSFRGACMEAIQLFQQGLGNPSYDAQIHWWIGLLNETVGEYDEARTAYLKAQRSSPEEYGALVLKKLAGLDARDRLRRPSEEAARLDRLPPIDEPDLAEARRELERNDGMPLAFFESD